MIRDSNKPMIKAMLNGFKVVDYGCMKDSGEEIDQKI